MQPFRPVSDCLSVTLTEYRADFCQAVTVGAAHWRYKTLAKTITIEILKEFSQLCDFDMVAPERVLCGFIADMCGTSFREVEALPEFYRSGCSKDRKQAKIYYYTYQPLFNKKMI